jgi:hypothetical protein
MALDEFMGDATVSASRVSLEDRRLGSSPIIIRMSAIRKLAAEAADNRTCSPAPRITAETMNHWSDIGW